MEESEEELKNLLIWVKRESEKASQKLNIKKQTNKQTKTKIMASGLITSWKTEGEEVEMVKDFLFLGSKITMDGDCSNETRIWLLLRRKALINLDSVLKSKNITLTTKVHIIKAMVFPVVMYGCESWAIKKAEH